jgi:hypothetical protein
MRKSVWSAVMVAGVVSGSAFAQKVNVVQEADKVVVRKKTVVDFTDVAIDGDLTKPEGSYSISKTKTKFKTLIKVRSDFNPELQKSTDSL